MKGGILPPEEGGTKASSRPASGEQPRENSSQQQHGISSIPPGVAEILFPTMKVGLAAGALGAFAGVVGGIATSASPRLFALYSGLQWFHLSTVYYGSRQVIFRSWGGHENLTRVDKIKGSAIAGGLAGMLTGAITRGRQHVIPGLIVWSLIGGGGQTVYGSIGSFNWGNRFLASKWSPLTPLTDRQYEKMLEEKLLKLDAEIAIIEDTVKALRNGEK